MNIEQEYKDKIIAVVSALIPEAKIYLFGSRATGKHAEMSDIDIALDVGQKIEPHWRIGEIRDTLQGLFIPYKIDVVDVYRIPDSMREILLEEKIVWKN